MNCNNTGASRRQMTSPSKSSVNNEPITRHMTFSAVLSPLELRRLVAAMVD